MASIVIVEFNGTVKTMSPKDLSFDNLYKKCGFRNGDGFASQCKWENLNIKGALYVNITLWGKDKGKSNNVNKYEFPPPVDTRLLYGSCALLHTDANNTILNLSKPEWLDIYEHLYGGFEDLVEESLSEDELAKLSPSKLTEHGYLKDGFIVDKADIKPINIPPKSKFRKIKPTVLEKSIDVIIEKDTEPTVNIPLQTPTTPLGKKRRVNTKPPTTIMTPSEDKKKTEGGRKKPAISKPANSKPAISKPAKIAASVSNGETQSPIHNNNELQEEPYYFSDEEIKL